IPKPKQLPPGYIMIGTTVSLVVTKTASFAVACCLFLIFRTHLPSLIIWHQKVLPQRCCQPFLRPICLNIMTRFGIPYSRKPQRLVSFLSCIPALALNPWLSNADPEPES